MKIYIYESSSKKINEQQIEKLQKFSFLISIKRINTALSTASLGIILNGTQYNLGEGTLLQLHFQSSSDDNRFGANEHPGAVGNAIFRRRFRLVFNSPSVYFNLHEILDTQQFLYCLEQLNEVGYLYFAKPTKYLKLIDSLEKQLLLDKKRAEDNRYFLNTVNKASKFSEEIEFLIQKNKEKRVAKKISENFSINLQLMGFSNKHSLNLKIDQISNSSLSQDTYVFVGANGLGKTQCLQELFSSINKNNHLKSNLIWFGFTRPNHVHQQQFRKVVTNFSNLNFSDLFRNIVINSSKYFDRIHFFQNEAKKVLKCDSITIKVGDKVYDGTKDREFLEKTKLAKVTVDFISNDQKITLSSGQSVFINTLCLILSNIEMNDILFLDEVDAFFHPRLCSEFIQSLNKILKETNSCAFFITHSVFTAREVLTPNIFHFSAHQNENNQRLISISKPSFNTFGASIDRLADYLFEDDSIIQAVERLTPAQKKSELISIDVYLGND